ncbi:MAG: hypothetical protein IRZ13_18955 [Acetobacteraceae bacterium]|nr:hypothetical protein [Acetobacteraceae bacterium]
MRYDPRDWYWIVAGDESHAWSSARAAYVPADDPLYSDWRQRGGQPTRIASEAELREVLLAQYPAGWPAGVRSVALWQAKAVMELTPHGDGTLLDAVEALMAQADVPTRAWWQHGTEIERDHARTVGMAAQLGIAEADLDALFAAAAAIEA